MCYRFSLAVEPETIRNLFDLLELPDLEPRHNIALSQEIAVVGRKGDGSGRGLVMMKWGFVPHWANDPADGPKPGNARAETIRTVAPFRLSFQQRRCLIPADGFYEWEHVGKKKIPWHFRHEDGKPFAFAGLWDVWKGGGRPLFTTCIITTTPNELIRPIHDRMPAVLMPEQYDAWLDPHTPLNDVHRLLKPAPEEFFTQTKPLHL